jgi:Lon protease-like protein
VATWQLCALAPIGPFDRQRLLEVDDPVDRLEAVAALMDDVAGMLAFRLAGGQ